MKTANFRPRKGLRVSILPDNSDEVFDYTIIYRQRSPIRDPAGGGVSPSYTFEIPFDGEQCDMTFGLSSVGSEVIASDDLGNMIEGFLEDTAIGPVNGEATIVVKGDHIKVADT
jgi:hypothetical protein